MGLTQISSAGHLKYSFFFSRRGLVDPQMRASNERLPACVFREKEDGQAPFPILLRLRVAQTQREVWLL
jgi:hypothetical protein